jgi:tRNA pseudouridine55 synthase
MTTNNGLLLLDKARGVTSHDVVSAARKIFRERRIGHAGTLDPMATGLLVLAVGPSTRLLRFAQGEKKHYVGTVQFGVATNSLDADGVVVATATVPTLTPEIVARAAASLTGPQMQIPPMVSALKQNGKRLHELARAGIEVERAPRAITIDEFSLTPTTDEAVWDFSVRCTPGTYVRVLLADLAERLGTIGHLTALRRLSSGHHHVGQALTLDVLQQRVAAGEFTLTPPRSFVEHLTTVQLDASDLARLHQGQQINFVVAGATDEVAVVDPEGQLRGIVHRRGESWQPDIVFHQVSA